MPRDGDETQDNAVDGREDAGALEFEPPAIHLGRRLGQPGLEVPRGRLLQAQLSEQFLLAGTQRGDLGLLGRELEAGERDLALRDRARAACGDRVVAIHLILQLRPARPGRLDHLRQGRDLRTDDRRLLFLCFGQGAQRFEPALGGAEVQNRIVVDQGREELALFHRLPLEDMHFPDNPIDQSRRLHRQRIRLDPARSLEKRCVGPGDGGHILPDSPDRDDAGERHLAGREEPVADHEQEQGGKT